MTSKEAIEIAKKAAIVAKQQRQNEADDEENEWFDSNIEALEKAEKDLEVLENFKKALGIDLAVLQELRKREWIVRGDNGEKLQVIGINFNTDNSLILYDEENQEMFTSDLRLEDYGKTWVLFKK